MCNQIWQSILPVLVLIANILIFYPWKKAKKNMLRQVDFCRLLICYFMKFKLSMGKNSAWYFFIPRSNLFLPVYFGGKNIQEFLSLAVREVDTCRHKGVPLQGPT